MPTKLFGTAEHQRVQVSHFEDCHYGELRTYGALGRDQADGEAESYIDVCAT